MMMAEMIWAALLQALLTPLDGQGCPAHSDPAEHLQHAIGFSVKCLAGFNFLCQQTSW